MPPRQHDIPMILGARLRLRFERGLVSDLKAITAAGIFSVWSCEVGSR